MTVKLLLKNKIVWERSWYGKSLINYLSKIKRNSSWFWVCKLLVCCKYPSTGSIWGDREHKMDDLQILLILTINRIRRVLHCPDQSIVPYSLFCALSLHTKYSSPLQGTSTVATLTSTSARWQSKHNWKTEGSCCSLQQIICKHAMI